MEKEKKPSKKQPAPAPAYDPAEVEARMRLAVAVEGLEHAMVSRDIEVIGSAIARFGPDAPDTDALWRATMLKKELFASIKEAKRQALLELVEYVNNTRHCFNDSVIQDVIEMVASNQGGIYYPKGSGR